MPKKTMLSSGSRDNRVRLTPPILGAGSIEKCRTDIQTPGKYFGDFPFLNLAMLQLHNHPYSS